MAEKDVSEKSLIACNDVAADIVNVLLFGGQRVVNDAELEEVDPHSFFIDEALRYRERDVIKKWSQNSKTKCYFAFENQTAIDNDMILRIFEYDSLNYRKQKKDSKDGKVYPVITIVLYYGKKHWDAPLLLSNRLEVNELLKTIFNDYKAHLFNIAEMNHEAIGKSVSDYGLLMDFVVQISNTGVYNMDDERIVKHPDKVFYFMYIWTGNTKFLELSRKAEKKEGKTMCKWIDDLCDKKIEEGIEQGIEQGIAKGIAKGKEEGLVNTAINMLNADFQVNVIAKMTGLSEDVILNLKQAKVHA